ncbi:hypothetical protein D3C71_1110220 [compost metagenome]
MATIGAVTMKMINSTNITSTSGVTLMSANGRPELPAALNAIPVPPGRGRLPHRRRYARSEAVPSALTSFVQLPEGNHPPLHGEGLG